MIKYQYLKSFRFFVLILVFFFPLTSFSQGLPVVTLNTVEGQTQYSLTLQLLALMAILTILPTLLLMMTSFVRIIIVLSLLRQALGTAQTPPNQVLIGLALFLSLFVMSPILQKSYESGVAPYIDGKLEFQQALDQVKSPIVDFMILQTRENDIAMFAEIARIEQIESPEQIPPPFNS